MICDASTGIAHAISRSAGTPASTTGSKSGSGQNSRNIGRASKRNSTPIPDMTAPPMAYATHPQRAARAGSRAPRFWPTSVIAAVPNAAPERNPSASHFSAMPCALS